MMMNDDQTPQITPADRTPIRDALKTIRTILDTDASWDDNRGFLISMNHELDEAQSFIRDHLDLAYGANASEMTDDIFYYEHLTREHAQPILDALQLLWADRFSRDELSNIAMSLSLCPMHFLDWACCFDDATDECAAIRHIFPFSHDT